MTSPEQLVLLDLFYRRDYFDQCDHIQRERQMLHIQGGYFDILDCLGWYSELLILS